MQRRSLRILLKARLTIFRILSRFLKFAPIAELAYSRYLLEQLWLAVRADLTLYVGISAMSTRGRLAAAPIDGREIWL